VPVAAVAETVTFSLAPTKKVLVIVVLVNDGAFPNTNAPDPVSSVTADAKFAEDGVAKNVATPVPSVGS
jgi:hypothetical protein